MSRFRAPSLLCGLLLGLLPSAPARAQHAIGDELVLDAPVRGISAARQGQPALAASGEGALVV